MNLSKNKDFKWKHYKDDKSFDLPIDYSDIYSDNHSSSSRVLSKIFFIY